jgi:hypothetical protein
MIYILIKDRIKYEFEVESYFIKITYKERFGISARTVKVFRQTKEYARKRYKALLNEGFKKL